MHRWRKKLIACSLLLLSFASGAGAAEKNIPLREEKAAVKVTAKSREDVRRLQEALKARGYDPGPVDGIQGSKTRAAIKAFQEASGLKGAGAPDDQTAEKLGIVKPARPAPLAEAPQAKALLAKLGQLILAAKAENELTLLGGGGTWGDSDAQKLLENGFNKKYGLNVRIKFVPGPSMPDMARRIADEYKAGQKSASDLFLGSESHFVELTRADALTRFPWREAFPNIPAAMVEMDGRLLREATRYIGISYNRQLVAEKDLPRRLDDLLNPKWKGKIASTPYAASFDRLVSVIGLDRTRDFLKRFTLNVAGLIRCGEEERLASGEFLMLGLNCGNYEAERAQRQGMPIGARVLTDVPIVGYWYLSIPKNSSHPNMATLFAGFLVTPEGQQVRYESVGATAHLVEGTPANKQYKELLAQGIQLKDFTAEYVIKNGKMLSELRDEFQKILQQR